MLNFLSKYLQLVCLSGFCVLIVLSILAFCNAECLKIKKDKNIASGIILAIVSIVYGLLAAFFYYREIKREKVLERLNSHADLIPLSHHNIQGNDNSDHSEYSRKKKSFIN